MRNSRLRAMASERVPCRTSDSSRTAELNCWLGSMVAQDETAMPPIRPMMMMTTISSTRVKAAVRARGRAATGPGECTARLLVADVLVGDVGLVALAAGRAVLAVGDDVELAAAAGRFVHVGLAPGVRGHGLAVEVGLP